VLRVRAPAISQFDHVVNADCPSGEFAGALTLSTAGLFAVSQWYYRRSLTKAWKNGKIEETTGV